MRIGIFFGGPAREREISFAGGKTAFEHLDKFLFEPVPVFVDSFGRFIKLKPEWMYEKDIRSFYPKQTSAGYSLYVDSFPEMKYQPVPQDIGELITPDTFAQHFDFAFLAMHGPDCEDGAIQGLLEWYKIPYSGPGVMGSAVGIDKILQNDMISLVNGQQKKTETITYADWISNDQRKLFTGIKASLSLPIVVKAPHQGSSIGVAIIKEDDEAAFIHGVNQCFFQSEVTAEEWSKKDAADKMAYAGKLANLDEGIGYPVQSGNEVIYNPEQLISYLDGHFNGSKTSVRLLSVNAEDRVLFEEFIGGQEFSCGCIQDEDGRYFALPPTEIIKVVEVFDFNSKYKPGATRKRIPVTTSLENNREIQKNIRTVAQALGIDVCVRIDGFLTPDDKVLLHDPNTIPGMSPTSLIFKQMAEIGLNVTQTITYLIRQSLKQRISTSKGTTQLRSLLAALDPRITQHTQKHRPEQNRIITPNDDEFADARKWWGQLNAEGKYRPVVILNVEGRYYRLPVPLMFKDYIEDVIRNIGEPRDALLTETSEKAESVRAFYAGNVIFEAREVNEKELAR